MDAIHPRVGFAKLLKSEHPVQLRSLGDGVNRLFGIAVSLVNALGGFCVIDEIENGIHYSVQADVWRFIFKLATQLDVQVFATTHSWDMVKAFQLAADESEEEGVLIRLARTGDRLWVAEYDEHDLEIAVDREIEVR
jgi:AAA15 family ATPase/GTPase